MSKLYNTYLSLKKKDCETIYLFKSGIFFIAIDKDAYVLSNIFNFKLVNLTDTIVKCGFPVNSLEKYTNLLKHTIYNFRIIDIEKTTTYTINDYYISEQIKNLLFDICNINTNILSIKDAYAYLDKLKLSAKSILDGIILFTEDLKGSIMLEEQAIQFIKILGINIKN